jgi:hypothetical protein
MPGHNGVAEQAPGALAQGGNADLILADAVFQQRRNTALAQLKANEPLGAALLNTVQQYLFGDTKLPALTQ